MCVCVCVCLCMWVVGVVGGMSSLLFIPQNCSIVQCDADSEEPSEVNSHCKCETCYCAMPAGYYEVMYEPTKVQANIVLPAPLYNS